MELITTLHQFDEGEKTARLKLSMADCFQRWLQGYVLVHALITMRFYNLPIKRYSVYTVPFKLVRFYGVSTIGVWKK